MVIHAWNPSLGAPCYEDHCEFKASLGYKVRSCLNNKNQNKISKEIPNWCAVKKAAYTGTQLFSVLPPHSDISFFSSPVRHLEFSTLPTSSTFSPPLCLPTPIWLASVSVYPPNKKWTIKFTNFLQLSKGTGFWQFASSRLLRQAAFSTWLHSFWTLGSQALQSPFLSPWPFSSWLIFLYQPGDLALRLSLGNFIRLQYVLQRLQPFLH